jgi:hypothetical protein
VALVGEAGAGGGLGERQPALDRGPGEGQAAHRPVPVGAGPEGPPEVAREGEAVGAGEPLQGRGRGRLARMGREVVARQLNRPGVDGDRALVGPAAERLEAVGDRGGDLGAGEVADGLVDVGEQGDDHAGGWRRPLDGIGDER